MKVGFFDSGIGGLTVLYEALIRFPQLEYIYYADTQHAPYGPKPKSVVRDYIFNAVSFLIAQDVDAIVIACNTATSVAITDLRERYNIPIIGIEPAVKPALALTHEKERVLVSATPLTIKEEKLLNLIDSLGHTELVDLVALPNLVKFAEDFDFSDETVIPYLKEAFSKYDLSHFKSVVFGCTHFPLFLNQYRQLFPKDVVFIDGSVGTINRLSQVLSLETMKTDNAYHVTYYQSGNRASVQTQNKFNDVLKHLYETKSSDLCSR